MEKQLTAITNSTPYDSMVGREYGRLTVEALLGRDSSSFVHLQCLCACGNRISALAINVRRGNTQSCGCRKKEIITTHGHSPRGYSSSEYNTWHSMLQRCTNPKVPRFHRYGGRGITVCERWFSFENFLADMGAKPFPKATIERKDNNGNYEPSNCIWASDAVQRRNHSLTRKITHNGITLCLADWARETGITYNALRYRLSKGWTIEQALTKPVKATG